MQGSAPCQGKGQSNTRGPSTSEYTWIKSLLGTIELLQQVLTKFVSSTCTITENHSKMEMDSDRVKSISSFKRPFVIITIVSTFWPKQGTHLSCDAWGYGIGAVLAHRMPDNSEKPIGYVSWTLSPAEPGSIGLCIWCEMFPLLLVGATFYLSYWSQTSTNTV